MALLSQNVFDEYGLMLVANSAGTSVHSFESSIIEMKRFIYYKSMLNFNLHCDIVILSRHTAY